MSFDLWLPKAKRPIVIVACVRHATGHPLPNARLVPPRWPGTGTVADKVLCLRDAMACDHPGHVQSNGVFASASRCANS